MNQINDRVKELSQYLGLGRTEFARKLDYSPSYTGYVMSGTANCSDEFISRVCGCFGVNEEWLRNGIGPMLVEERAAADPDGLCNRVKQQRERLNLNQGQLSNMVGINRMYMCWIERGKRIPSEEIIMKLAIALDVSFDWLMTGGGEMVPPNEIRQALNDEGLKRIIEYLGKNEQARETVDEIYKNNLWEMVG